MAKNNGYVAIAILLIVALLTFLVVSGNNKAKVSNAERFYADAVPALADTSVAARADATASVGLASGGVGDFVGPSDPRGNEAYNPVTSDAPSAAPAASCFPRDRLTADDLLPKDAANSRWAQANPAGQGDVSNQNFLTAGYHVGVDTVGSSKKNANLQLRSEPPNPQQVVSPWLQSTITPSDVGKPVFEIGTPAASCYA